MSGTSFEGPRVLSSIDEEGSTPSAPASSSQSTDAIYGSSTGAGVVAGSQLAPEDADGVAGAPAATASANTPTPTATGTPAGVGATTTSPPPAPSTGAATGLRPYHVHYSPGGEGSGTGSGGEFTGGTSNGAGGFIGRGRGSSGGAGIGGLPQLAVSAGDGPPNVNSQVGGGSGVGGVIRVDTLGFGSPSLRRRATTFRTVEDFEEFSESRPGWRPGAEPGVDTSKPDGGHASMPNLHAECEIAVVDFSQDRISEVRLTNDTLGDFLAKPQQKWVKCRWINVNGLSWDVIQLLGEHKKLHRLAVEDILNTRNRTKADWYSNHAFIVLTLQKLVHVVDEDASDDEDDDRSYISKKSTRSIKGLRTLWRRLFGGAKEPPSQGQARDAEAERGKAYGGGRAKVTNLMGNGSGNHIYQHAGANNYRGKVTSQPTGFSEAPSVTNLRTLHRYHATSNELRADFMEKHSALASRQMAVTAEQVSIFVTSDNTIISFFELSALDVQRPILTRLNTAGTILRQSCDAFMVAQAIIDAITDLAIPVTALYGEVIGDLEVDVLTRPTIEHTKSLYIIICEINKLLSFIKPVVNLVTALRDHKTDGGPEAAAGQLQDPTRGVVVTPVTYTYLGDVLDHLLLIADSLEQIRGTADGLIGLIFNTISNDQNRNMQQLTVTTIFFLPMTFITGYFGQNFDNFTELTYGTSYFWKIAAPTAVATIVILLWPQIIYFISSLWQRRQILEVRRRRKKLRALRKR